VADSMAASRKPKMAGAAREGTGAFPPDGVVEPEDNRAEVSTAAERSFMGAMVKASKLAQVLAALLDLAPVFGF